MRCCCVIPVFNHAATAPAVIERTRAVMPDVLVIDDGSEDINLAERYAGTGVEVIRHPRNMGKGAALLTAIRTLAPRGYDYMITIDADAQHDPEDIRSSKRTTGRSSPGSVISPCRTSPDAANSGVRSPISGSSWRRGKRFPTRRADSAPTR